MPSQICLLQNESSVFRKLIFFRFSVECFTAAQNRWGFIQGLCKLDVVLFLLRFCISLGVSLSIRRWSYTLLMQYFGMWLSMAERNMPHQFESVSSILPGTKHKFQRVFPSNTLSLDQSDLTTF